MENVIKNGDACILYNIRSKQWVGNAKLQIMSDSSSSSNKSYAYPTLTNDPNQAEVLICTSTRGGQKSKIRLKYPFTLQTTDNITESANFFSTQLNSKLFKQVIYSDNRLHDAVEWKFDIKNNNNNSIGDKYMRYGVPSKLIHNLTGALLTTHNISGKLELITKQNNYHDSSHDATEWVFLPVSSLYTCLQATGGCQETSGIENAFIQLHCNTDNKLNYITCQDQFKDKVYFSSDKCKNNCTSSLSTFSFQNSGLSSGDTSIKRHHQIENNNTKFNSLYPLYALLILFAVALISMFILGKTHLFIH